MLYGALVYFLIFSITLGYLIRHGRNSTPRRILQLLAALAWPLYWLVIVGVPGTVAILLSAMGDVLRSGASLLATTDEALGRPGETLRWLYFLPLAAFPMFYIYGHWKVDELVGQRAYRDHEGFPLGAVLARVSYCLLVLRVNAIGLLLATLDD